MTFEEHLEATRDSRGVLHLDLAEMAMAEAIAEELATDDTKRQAIAQKAAQAERKAFRDRERKGLTKILSMAPLSSELWAVLDTKVLIGESEAVDYGDVNGGRVRLRKDIVERNHRDQQRAYVREMDHWDGWLGYLQGDETIREALDR